ncbi:MAG: 3-oxoacyl-ACP reductase, partial [Mesorhizobium sp.]
DVPLGRPARPVEVPTDFCFGAWSAAAMLNGAILPVDGGAAVVDLPTLAFVD